MPPPRKPKHLSSSSSSKKQSSSSSSSGRQNNRSSGKKKFEPQTEDEFLYVGSIEEEHGDRWSVGDPDKAHRFYVRALDWYDQCLTRFPSSFDAAYNKCRLEFHVFQNFYARTVLLSPTTASSNDGAGDTASSRRRQDRVDILAKILADHEQALSLATASTNKTNNNNNNNNNNAIAHQLPSDLLFNMAQVQVSLAEEQYAPDPFRAAFDTFERTYAVQEAELASMNSEISSMLDHHDATAADGGEDEQQHPQAEEYATVIEPTTPASLLETACAQLSCLIPIYTIALTFSTRSAGPVTELASDLQSAGNLVMHRISRLLSARHELGLTLATNHGEDGDDVIADAGLIVTRYVAVSGFPFDHPIGGNLDRLIAIWAPSSSAASFLDTQLLADHDQNVRLRDLLDFAPTESPARFLAQADMFTQFGLLAGSDQNADTAWKAFSVAAKCLTSATALAANPKKASTSATTMVIGAGDTWANKLAQVRIWITRGDLDLLRASLSPISDVASRNHAVLIKSAEVYYRNAAKVASSTAQVDPEVADAGREARIKSAVVVGDRDGVVTEPQWQDVVAEAVEDAVFSEEQVRQLVANA
ncbi:hypothetical protein V1514DRAFT_5308 [Lipomyces japonicus]|uniref:uncharacterized protein n=1 Tax=Lipomyces japonicus TaxID=56871 RepID=UPI0034CD7DA3